MRLLSTSYQFGSYVAGAYIQPPTIGNPGTDYATRAFIARVGLTANTPYEAVYWGNRVDSEGRRMNGDSKYGSSFKEAIPYIEPGFWSVTLYDAENNYTVANPINRYMLGSDSPLKKNPDGSFTIYIQSDIGYLCRKIGINFHFRQSVSAPCPDFEPDARDCAVV